MLDEATSLEGKHKDVTVLSSNVSQYLVGISEPAKAEVEEGTNGLTNKYNR